MKAAVVTENGVQYKDAPKPSPNAHEILIKVKAASLNRADLAVACDSKRLSEVRLCLNKDFSFRGCPDVARRACKSESVALPAMRGG